jgi:hypothetical protein
LLAFLQLLPGHDSSPLLTMHADAPPPPVAVPLTVHDLLRTTGPAAYERPFPRSETLLRQLRIQGPLCTRCGSEFHDMHFLLQHTVCTLGACKGEVPVLEQLEVLL